jgi:hypothetical protein
MGLAYIVCVLALVEKVVTGPSSTTSRFLRGRQGDQIGRIFAFRVIIYFGQFF